MAALSPLVCRASLHRSSLGGPSSRQLDGGDAAAAPEQGLLSSLVTCLLIRFEACAARDGLALDDWSATVTGTIEPTPEGLMFTSILIGIELAIACEVERVEATLDDAKQDCLVLNSLRVPVVIETQVRSPSETAPLPGGAPAYPVAAAGAGGSPL